MQIALACKTLPAMPHKWCAWMSQSNESIKKNSLWQCTEGGLSDEHMIPKCSARAGLLTDNILASSITESREKCLCPVTRKPKSIFPLRYAWWNSCPFHGGALGQRCTDLEEIEGERCCQLGWHLYTCGLFNLLSYFSTTTQFKATKKLHA